MPLVVGVIGTGLMGKPMARNLLRAGYSVVVQNRTASKLKELVEAGAIAAPTPRSSHRNATSSSRC